MAEDKRQGDDAQKAQIAKILGYLEEIRHKAVECSDCISGSSMTTSSEKQANWNEKSDVRKHEGVITIYGGRGTGKSTLIQLVSNELREGKKDFVIGPISPDHFQETKSLFSYMLAVLHDKLFGSALEFTDCCQPNRGKNTYHAFSDRGEDLRNKLRNMRNYVARTIPVSLETLVNSGKSGEDFAYQFTDIQDRHVKAHHDFPELIHNLLKYYRDVKRNVSESQDKFDGLLVVAVDDCDLYPDLIRFVLDDIQRMGHSPNIAILFAAHEKELFRAVGENILNSQTPKKFALLKEFGLTDSEQLWEETTEYIRKVCPMHHEVRLDQDLDVYQARMSFTPIETSKSLNADNLTLCNIFSGFKFRYGTFSLFPTLLSIFSFKYVADKEDNDHKDFNSKKENKFIYSPFCDLLPPNRRSLSEFYQIVCQALLGSPIVNTEHAKEIFIDQKIATDLIQAIIQLSRYRLTPVKASRFDHYKYWRSGGIHRQVHVEHYEFIWSFRRGKNITAFSIPIQESYVLGFEKCIPGEENISVSIEFSFIADAGVVYCDDLSDNSPHKIAKEKYTDNLEKKRLEDVFQWRFLTFVFELVRLSHLEHVLFGVLPLAVFPSESYEGPVYSKLLKYDFIKVPMPSYVSVPFPNYSSFYMFRRFWNDQLHRIANLMSMKGNCRNIKDFEKESLSYLCMLRLYLMAVVFLCPTLAKKGFTWEGLSGDLSLDLNDLNKITECYIGDIKDSRLILEDEIYPAVANIAKFAKDEINFSGQDAAYHCAFLLYCAQLKGHPAGISGISGISGKSISCWIDENVFSSIKDYDTVYKSELANNVKSVLDNERGLNSEAMDRPDGLCLMYGVFELLDIIGEKGVTDLYRNNFKESFSKKWNN